MYLYFDSKGTLLETINDEALRQYNKGVNTVNVFIEDANNKDSGKIPWDIFSLSYWFELPTGDTLKNGYLVDRDNDLKRKTIPFDRNRDLKYFRYGKVYEFFEIKLPSAELLEFTSDDGKTIDFVSDGDVFSSGGLVLMTIQAGIVATEDSKTVDKWLSLERVAFTVEDAVILPDDTVTGSEFNWLLQKYAYGDYLRPQLVYGKISTKTTELETANFNRMPSVGDKFLYVYYYYSSAEGSSNITVLEMGEVVSVTDTITTCTFSSTNLRLTGPQGEQGEPALVYSKMLNFIIEKDKTYHIPKDGFNREGIKGEVFVAYSNKAQYATFEFIDWYSYSGAEVKALEVITTTGKVLFYNDIITIYKVPASNDRYTVSADKFNDEPVNGDYALIKMEYGTRTFLAVAQITITSLGEYYAYVHGDPLETTGATGPTGAKIVSTELRGQDTNGGNVYLQTFDDGSTATFTAPKGAQGTQGTQGKTGSQGPQGEPALVYSKQVNAATVSEIFLIGANFNHKPTIGEACTVVWIETGSNDTYILSSIIKSVFVDQYHLDETKTDRVKITGPQGPMGTVFTPVVSEEGILSWTNNGSLDNPESVNIKGPKGATGAKIVSTALTGQDTSGGNVYLQTFDDGSTATFTAPKGTQGTQGATGATGKVALQFDGILEIDNPLKIEDFLQDGSYRFDVSDYSDNFNRTPVRGDSFLALAKYTYAPYNVFLVSAYIMGVSLYIKIAKYCDVSGQVGPRGADGVGISTASVTATTTEEKYTTTTVTLTKTDSTTDTVEIKAKNGVNPNTVSYIGTALVSDWSDSTAYSAYGYKYSALLPFTSGAYATDTYVPDVVPSIVADIASGNFAPFANSTAAGVEVYAKAKPTANTNFNVSLSHVQ